MLKKFLKEMVVSIAGKQAEGLIDLLDGKKYINEFLIAKKLDLTINQTRNILYKISNYGLVSFIRKKDKRKGWYTYFWKLEILKSLEFLRSNIVKNIDQVHHQIKSRETKEFYICERCNIEFNEETALIHNFTCNECGNLLARKDNALVIKEYNKTLDRLRKELGLIDEELKIERDKLEKRKVREIKKKKRIKKEEKAKKIKSKQTTKKKITKKKTKPKKIKKKSASRISKKKTPKKSTKKKSTKKTSKR